MEGIIKIDNILAIRLINIKLVLNKRSVQATAKTSVKALVGGFILVI